MSSTVPDVDETWEPVTINKPTYVPLIYPNDSMGCSHVLLIDDSIMQPDFIASCANEITYPITYSHFSKKTELLSLLLSKFTTIDRIAIAFTLGNGGLKPFLDNEPFFISDESYVYSENIEFILTIIKLFHVKQIDFLACNTLNYTMWINYYDIIKNESGVTIGASNNTTGNMMYNGDWVMESIKQDIELVYFTTNIELYKYLLDVATQLYTLSTTTRTITAFNGFLYLILGTSVVKYSFTSNTALWTLTVGSTIMANQTPWALCNDGTYLYIFAVDAPGTSNAVSIMRINQDGTNSMGGTTKWNTSVMSSTQPFSMCTDSQFLYTSSGSVTNTIYKINLSTAATSTFKAGVNAYSMTTLNGYLYLSLSSGTSVVRYNTTTAALDTSWNPSLGKTALNSITTDGTYIYASNTTSLAQILPDTTGTIVNLNYLTGLTTAVSTTIYNNVMYISDNGPRAIYYYNIPQPIVSFPCFKEGTLILTDKGYVTINNLRNGDLVKTVLHDYVPVYMIGRTEIIHNPSTKRTLQQLYQCSKENYPELIEPLIITGCHSILVDDFINEEQKKRTMRVNRQLFVTDNKYRLPVCVDERATVYDIPGPHMIYHLALENENYYANYGIYANGLLVETCSKRFLGELSNMELI